MSYRSLRRHDQTVTTMFEPLRLLLPALIPSWNFFDWVAPSPRIEVALLRSPDDADPAWREFRPRPRHLSPGAMLGRLFWNPRWNETLFLISCAERLAEYPTAHSANEIFRRIAHDLPATRELRYLRFRLVFVSRSGDVLERAIRFESDVRAREDALAR
ncbi:MAG: hypothetical protein R3E87_03930 [Burkholderiaceae bacterium]